MRKILLLLALLVTSFCKVNAQASGYAFSSSSGTYTAITGGTVIRDGTSTMDSYVSGAITIPSFTFCGTAYTTAYATSNGLLTLGGSAPSAYTSTGISSNTGSGIAICPMSADLDRANINATTEMRWETVGDEVVFQWKQMKRYGQTENFDFQARLNTVSGVITFVYQLNSGPGTGTSYQPQVGIRTSTTDFKNRLVASGSETWASPLAGTLNTNTCRFTAASPAKSFTSGLTYTFTPPACAAPGSLSAGSVTTTSASISFGGAGTAFILEYGAPGFTPGTDNNAGGGTIVTGSASPIAISGLTANTTYDVYIRQDCGGGIYSVNSAKVTFTTLCDAVTTYPYTEGFNSVGVIPSCWSVAEGSPGASYHWQAVAADATHGAGSAAEGAAFMIVNYYNASTTYNPYYLKSVPFDLGASAKRAKFAIWMGANSGTNNLKFEISNDGGTTWTTLDTYTANPANSSSSAPWDNGKIVDLSAYTNQTVIFRLNATSNYGSGFCNIGFDNFVVEDLPACAEPTALSAGSVTNNSASISFTGAGTAYILEYGAAGFTPGTDNNPGGGTIVTGSGSPIAITGLTNNTTYDVYIRQDCGGGVYSVNSTKVTFTTICAIPTALSAGSITTTSASISFTGSGSAYILEYGASGFTPGTDNNPGAGTIVTGSGSPIAMSGLTSSTIYDVYIRRDCGGGDYSANSAKLTFTTLCDAVTTYPYTEGFNSSTLPVCWSVSEGSPGASQHWQPVTADATHGAGASAEGSHFLRMNYYSASTTYNPYYLKSLSFDLGATAKRAKFAIWMGSASGTNNLKFEISTDNGGSWTTLETYTANPANSSSSAPWDSKTVDLSSYTNQTVIFRLNATSNFGSGYCNIGFDNFVVEDLPACAEPTGLSAGSVTNNAASISFTSGGNNFILEYGAAGFTPGTDNNAGVGGTIVLGSGSPIALSGLTGNTTYDVYIRQDCGAGVYSPNSTKTTFTTLCDVVSTYPYNEGFNAASLSSCWSVSEGSPGASQHWQPVTADATHGAGASAEGSHFLRMNYYNASTTYNPYYLKSLSFDLGATAKRAKFAIWMGSASGTNNLKFEISTDGGGTWTTLETYTANPANSSSSAPWDSKTVDLSSYTNQTVIFRLNATSNFGSDYCNIGFDNFVVEDLPACAEPTGLSMGSITQNAASASFTGGGSAFIVEYGAPGFTPGTDDNAGVGGTIVTGGASPIAISGLTANTTYDVYVRQDCGGGIYSPNSAKATFTTLCNTTNVPYTQNFESALVPALPACTSQEQLGLGNTWVTVSNPGNGFTSNTLKYTYNTDNPANVWFYTQGVNLTNGVAYTISYNYGNNSTTYAPEKLKVAYGTAANNGAMINVLADHPNINQSAIQSNTVVFTPSATGVYYFGFHAYSDADKFNLYVDNIMIDVAPWTWTGTTNTDWNTASNWDLGSVPTSSDNVVIADVTNEPVIGSGIFAVKNLTINSSSSLTINGTLQVNGNIINSAAITGIGSLTLDGLTAQTFNVGTSGATIASFSLNNTAGATLSGSGKLNVTNVLTVQDGSTLTTGGIVVLKSDASNTARLAPLGTGIINGDVTVERFIPAKASRSWSLLSSPVTQSLQNSWQQQIHITGAGTGGTVCPSLTAHTNGFDATATNAPSAYTYDASQAQGSRWQAVSNTNATNVGQGKGFRVNVRGPRSLGCDLLNGVNMVPSAATLSATGTLSNSDKNLGSFSITYPNNGTNNWVMVGNPYPSALNYVTLQGDNGTQIDDAYAIYIPGNAPGTYSYWSDADGFFTGGTGYDNGKGNTIASGQAVFFKSIVAGIVSLDFNEAQKDVDGTAGYFRNNRRTINEKVKVSFGTTDKKIDEVVVRYANDATVSNTAISKMDIPSMNSGTYITSLKGNKPMVVQTRALNTLSTDEVWLNIGATQSGNYTFNFSDYENFAGTEIYLVDHLAKATQNIKENPTYVFSVDVNNAATKGSERFSLVFNRNVQPSVVYNTIKMYPNPANKQVTFLLPQSADISYNIKVTDMAGKIVLQHKAAGGTEQMSVDKLTTGTYIVEIIDNKGNRTTEKLIKN